MQNVCGTLLEAELLEDGTLSVDVTLDEMRKLVKGKTAVDQIVINPIKALEIADTMQSGEFSRELFALMRGKKSKLDDAFVGLYGYPCAICECDVQCDMALPRFYNRTDLE